MKKQTKKLQRFWWMIPIVLIVVSLGAGYVILNKTSGKKSATIVKCSTIDADQFKCWQKRYQAMVEQQSPKEALVDVRSAYDTVGYVKTNCHQIAHVIGRAAGKKYGDVGKAYEQGDDFCWSGYYHGVMETISQKIGPEKILEQLPTICESVRQQREYSFAHYNCVHGLGHGLMAVKNNHLFDALKGCDRLGDSWQQQSCQGGVFMENVMSEFNPGSKSEYLKADDPLYPCTAVEDAYKMQCYLMQTSHALVVVNRDFNKVFELCATVANPYDTICYQSLGRDISGNSSSDVTFTKNHCEAGPSKVAQENCVVGAVKDFIAYFHSDQQGLALCEALSDAAIKQTCVDTAKSYYSTF